MRPAAALLVCLLAALPLGGAVAQDSLITVQVAASATDAQALLTRAMMKEGLSIAETSPNIVVATGTERKNTIDVRYSGVLLPTGTGTEITLSAVATAKARLMGARVESRVTSKLKGGKDVWARLQRIADALASSPATSSTSQ